MLSPLRHLAEVWLQVARALQRVRSCRPVRQTAYREDVSSCDLRGSGDPRAVGSAASADMGTQEIENASRRRWPSSSGVEHDERDIVASWAERTAAPRAAGDA